MSSKQSVRKIASIAHVSPATVSRVLNNSANVSPELRERVVAALAETGYASPLWARGERSSRIAMLIPEMRNPFYSEVIRGVLDTASAAKYNLLLCSAASMDLKESSEPSFLFSGNWVDGVISTQKLKKDSRLLSMIPTGTPVVQCCEYNETLDMPLVSIDNYQAACSAAEHLLDIGRRNIAFFGGDTSSMYSSLREAGYRDTMARYGAAVREDWVVQLGGVDYSIALSASRQLFSQEERPDAVFAASDVIAAGVINGIRSCGLKVPEDVSVVGFDDVEVAQMGYPSITTVRQPRYKMGCTACSMLLQLIETGSVPSKNVMLPSELIVRDSS